MGTISTQELREHLAEMLDRAAAGEEVVVTRHQRPIARLVSTGDQGVRVGGRVGKGELGPAVIGGARGRLRELLEEDRRERLDASDE